MLRFAPIDLELRSRAAVAIRADSFEISFGSSDEFFEEYGVTGEGYLDHLPSRMPDQPGSVPSPRVSGPNRIDGQRPEYT